MNYGTEFAFFKINNWLSWLRRRGSRLEGALKQLAQGMEHGLVAKKKKSNQLEK